MVTLYNLVKAFVDDESGQDMVEYSLLLVLLAATAIIALTGMGQSIASLFTALQSKLSTATVNIQ